MSDLLRGSRAGRGRVATMLLAACAGLATAALVGVALARAFTLRVAKNATVTDTRGLTSHENIVVSSQGFAVYYLTGESKRHPKCVRSNGCFQFWPPLTVSSSKRLSKAPGIKGKLGAWRRAGFIQLTLGGRPLYRYALDRHKRAATGEGIRSFHGTWHAIKAGAASNSTNPGGSSGSSPSYPTSSSSTPTTTTSPTTPYMPH